jgi:hypothetical protein
VAQIPIKETIVRTYRYTFDNFRVLFGLTWLAALAFTTIGPLARALVGESDRGAKAIATIIALFVIYTAGYSVAAIAVTRQTLGMQSGFRPFHLSFGKAEWRLFVSNIQCVAAIVAVMLLLILGIAISLLGVAGILTTVGITVTSVPDSLPGAFIGTLLLAAMLAGFSFVGVRYFFFLPLAAVVSPDQQLGRSYDLSAGNFWTIFAVGLAAMAPTILIGVLSSLPQLLSQLVSFFSNGLHWPTAATGVKPTSVAWQVMTLGTAFITTVLNWALMAIAAVFASEAFLPSQNIQPAQ